jgi:hypothetical protein
MRLFIKIHQEAKDDKYQKRGKKEAGSRRAEQGPCHGIASNYPIYEPAL